MGSEKVIDIRRDPKALGSFELKNDALEIHPYAEYSDNVRLLVGITSVIEIDKMFGPLVMADIRIKMDYAKAEWVIERKCRTGNVSFEWREVARVSGQIEEDFKEWEKD